MASMSWHRPKDIAEVQNAYEIYGRLKALDPYSMDDLLTALGIMTRGLVEESGCFRSRPVGVVDQQAISCTSDAAGLCTGVGGGSC